MTLYGVNLADMTNILQTRNPILHLFRPHLTGEVFSSGDRFDGYGIRLDRSTRYNIPLTMWL